MNELTASVTSTTMRMCAKGQHWPLWISLVQPKNLLLHCFGIDKRGGKLEILDQKVYENINILFNESTFFFGKV